MDTPGSRSKVGGLIDGKYKVVRVIAGGGMGEVYEAVHIFLDQRVAAKTLRPDVAAAADASKWFLREAQILAKVEHPNVVRVSDFGTDRRDGSLYLVQELLDGLDLERHLTERGRLTPARRSTSWSRSWAPSRRSTATASFTAT